MKPKQWKEAANILEKKLMTKLNEIQSALLDSMIIALEEVLPPFHIPFCQCI